MPHPDWLDSITPGDVIGALLALALIGGFALVLVRFVHPIMAKLTRMLDLFLGRPADQGIPAVPGVMERLDDQDDRLRKLEAAVETNHGKRLGQHVEDIKADVVELGARLDAHLQK